MAGASYTAVTLTTTLTAGQMAAYYDSTFLDHYKEQIFLIPYAQSKPLPKYKGKTIDFFRYHKLAIVTSEHTEGSQSVTAESIKGMNITATLDQYNKLVDWSELEEITHRDPSFRSSVSGLLGENAAESMDWKLMKEVAKWGIYAIRADFNATYERDVTCSTSLYYTAEGDMLYSAALTESHDPGVTSTVSGFWSGAWVTVTAGRNYGECRRATHFQYSTDSLYFLGTVTYPAGTADAKARGAFGEKANYAIDANDYMTIHVCTPYNLKNSATTDDIMTGGGGVESAYLNVDVLLKARTILAENGAKAFGDGKYKCVCSYSQYLKLFKDSDWKTMNTYTPREGIITGQVGTLANMDIMTTTQAYRENASTHLPSTDPKTLVGTGVDVVLCFGQNAFGAVDISGVGGPKDPEIGFRDTKSDTGDPTHQTDHAYWKIYSAFRPINANWCVGILCKSIK